MGHHEFFTSVLDGGDVSFTLRPLYPCGWKRYPLDKYIDALSSEAVWTVWRREKYRVGFEVLTVVVKNVAIFWDIASYSLYVYRHFCLAICYSLVSSSANFRHWTWNWQVPPKRWLTYGLHCAISQKTETLKKVSPLQRTETRFIGSAKVKSRYDWRPVIQYVLILSPFWFSWQDACYCLTVTVVSLWDALSDERSGLSFASQSLQYLVVCQHVHKY
jgi:hypothetical protein